MARLKQPLAGRIPKAVAPEIAATGGAPGFIFRDDAHVDAVPQGEISREVSAIARAKPALNLSTMVRSVSAIYFPNARFISELLL